MKRVCLLAVVVLSATFAAGCSCSCGRKGVVLRGDWSLELNRVGHLTSNGPQYAGDCDSCCDYGCAEVIPSGCTHGAAPGCMHGGHSGCGGGRAGLSHRQGGEFYDEYSTGDGEHMPPPPQPTAAAQTRFHPVPTKPVFEPDVGPEILDPVRPAATGADWKSKRRA